jgi:hypothetical protein
MVSNAGLQMVSIFHNFQYLQRPGLAPNHHPKRAGTFNVRPWKPVEFLVEVIM